MSTPIPFKFRKFAIFYIIFQWIYLAESKVNYMFFEILCYENPSHVTNEGSYCDFIPDRRCDPMFEVCISAQYIKRYSFTQRSCELYYFLSHSYNNIAKVCRGPKDNRKSDIQIPIRINIGFPIRDNYYVRVTVWDRDLGTRSKYAIGHFGVETKHLHPSPNGQLPNMTKAIMMDRTEEIVANKDAYLQIALGLQCDKGYYGRYCSVYCYAHSGSNFKCDKSGNKICHKGWMGKECDVRDKCYFMRCAKNADCVKTPKGKVICLCNDMTTGPHCYDNYDPCESIKCENNGRCEVAADNKTPYCVCESPYYGKTCNLDPCSADPCLNGGTCVWNQTMTDFLCLCGAEYQGTHCENETVPTVPPHKTNDSSNNKTPFSYFDPTKAYTTRIVSTSQLSLLLLIIVGILMLCIAVLVVALLFNRQSKRRKFDKLPTLSINQLLEKEKVNDRRLLSPSSNGTSYSGVRLADSVYETVEDTCYSKLEDDCAYTEVKDEPVTIREDDYMQPIPDQTLTHSPTDDDYLPMNIYLEQHLTSSDPSTPESISKNEERQEPPPLPTRISFHLRQQANNGSGKTKWGIQKLLCVKEEK